MLLASRRIQHRCGARVRDGKGREEARTWRAAARRPGRCCQSQTCALSIMLEQRRACQDAQHSASLADDRAGWLLIVAGPPRAAPPPRQPGGRAEAPSCRWNRAAALRRSLRARWAGLAAGPKHGAAGVEWVAAVGRARKGGGVEPHEDPMRTPPFRLPRPAELIRDWLPGASIGRKRLTPALTGSQTLALFET